MENSQKIQMCLFLEKQRIANVEFEDFVFFSLNFVG